MAVSVYLKAPADTGSIFERLDFFNANYAKFTDDDKFLVLNDLNAKNCIMPIGEVARFRAEYVIGYDVDNDGCDDDE